MITFDHIDRNYEVARERYKHEIPEHFNFAFDVLDVRAKEADRIALLAIDVPSGEKAAIPYSELSTASAKFAQALMALGLKRGDAACIVIGREPSWHKVLFGCMKAGVISMPGTNLLTAKDIAYRVNQAGAKVVIVSPMHVEKVEAIRDACPTLLHMIVIGEATGDWLSFEALCAAQDGSLTAEDVGPFAASETMMIYFTSGTTALPKMVPRDFGYALAHASTALFWMDLRESDMHWTLTDTGWAKAAWGMLFPQMLMGCTTVLYDAPGMDVDAHLKTIGEIGVTTFCAPPTVYRLFAQQDLSKYDLSSLRRCLGAGEPLNPEVIRYWHTHTGTTIADGYGQTETICIVGNFPGVETRHGSMGKPVPGFNVDVVDDEGAIVPDGEVGHIGINTSQGWPAGLFHGYLRDGELVKDAFRHGWYYTGDTASRDADGYLWFVGRSDDLISSAGYRISPFEVESALLEHDKIMESAVIGVPDETRGQLVKAYIILAEGVDGTPELAEDIQTFCKNLTAPYKYPREIEFVKELPKTISGKIRRVELRQT
ncbi:MAG: AMP-binding protein [Pseudomonadota bacterium]